MNALVITYNHILNYLNFILISYPDKGLFITALGRKRSIFYYNMFYCQMKNNFTYVNSCCEVANTFISLVFKINLFAKTFDVHSSYFKISTLLAELT